MNIDTPLRELGSVDINNLRDAILSQENAAWDEEQLRQEEYEVHKATKSIVMIFVNLDHWPEIEVQKRNRMESPC